MSKTDSSKPYLLRCENLTKSFGNVEAITDLSFTSYTSFLGLLGPNGSGKSTLIKLLLGLLQPTSGEIELGVNREAIRVIPDFPSLPTKPTLDSWIDILEEFYGKAPPYLDFETDFRLNGSWKIANMSVGQKRIVSLLPIFFGTPELIILDEPTNFLDVIRRTHVLNLIKDQIQRTKTRVIIASHRIDEIELLASEIVMLNRGTLMAKISLKHDYRLGYLVRVSNTDAFTTYLKNHGVEYEIEDTLLGKSVKIQKLNDLLDPIAEYNRDGGFVFNINAVNSLQKRLGEMV